MQIKPAGFLKFALYSILMFGLYYSTIIRMITKDWERDTYNYCWLIPPIVLYLIWIKRHELSSLPSKSSWMGLLPIGAGIVLFWLGELSAEYFSLYISFWLVLVGICLLHLGWEKIKVISFALFFMITMFPLPNIISAALMLKLQLISSKLGVAIIQLYGLPVSRQGNIIDLGFTQLQVVEACSGLNSLISLVVLSLLLVYFFKAHIWKRCFVVLSSVPLAIFTNSLRIAMTAILHKYFGYEVAQGFFHGFSGLVIFLFCMPVLLIEVKILEKLPPVEKKSKQNKLADNEGKEQIQDYNPADQGQRNQIIRSFREPVFIVALILLGSTVALSQGVEFREKVIARKSISQFPLEVGEWKASNRDRIEQKVLDELGLSDYVWSDYKNPSGNSVNFYLAYYKSQSKGKTIHSPESCIPGSGWSFQESGLVSISNIPGNSDPLKINRAIIKHGEYTQISYFWFSQRGRILSNGYQVKLYNFWDALTLQRTDGALIRLITPVYENEKLEDAESRLQGFVRDIVPVLEEYIPGKNIGDSL